MTMQQLITECAVRRVLSVEAANRFLSGDDNATDENGVVAICSERQQITRELTEDNDN